MRTTLMAAIAAGAAAAAVVFLVGLPPRIAGELATLVAARTGHAVDIGTVRWSISPRLRLVGTHITIGRTPDDTAPLVAIGAFSLEASLGDLMTAPRRIQTIDITELDIRVPRRPPDPRPTDAPAPPPEPDESRPAGPPTATPLVIERLTATRARVEIAAARPGRPPRVFNIESLRLRSLALDRPIGFDARVLIPQPAGHVAATGTIGPWQAELVRDTPIEGRYTLSQADLSTLSGLTGTLDSTGSFEGTLGQIRATGQADIPDFSATAGQVVPLRATFDVEVGDDGTVHFSPVRARFLDSVLDIDGTVRRVPGARERTVALDVAGDQARVEDVLRLGLDAAPPPLTGQIDLQTRLEVPPGDRPVLDRLALAGTFLIREARFTNVNVQETLIRLSRAGGGPPEAGSSVVSNLEGAFTLADATLEFSRLTFAVPGMAVQLVGDYGLRDGLLDFRGRVVLDRTVSELVPPASVPAAGTRWLELLDPIFQPEDSTGGTAVPLTISGPRTAPSFRLDVTAMTPDWRRLLDRLR